MDTLLVGYARVSTEHQDLTAQRDGLRSLGVGDDRIYVDHGLTGTNRDRPGLRLALAACRTGDTLVVTKLDRLSRSRRAGYNGVRATVGYRVRPAVLLAGIETIHRKEHASCPLDPSSSACLR